MSQCPRCRNVISHNETFCGQCGAKINPQKTTVFVTATTAIDFVAATVPALNNAKVSQNTKRFLVVFAICLLLFGIFVCGQVTKFSSVTAKENTSGNNAPTGLQLPQATQPITQVPVTVSTPTATPSLNQIPTSAPSITPPEGIYHGFIHNEVMASESGMTLDFTLKKLTFTNPQYKTDEGNIVDLQLTGSILTFTLADTQSGYLYNFSGTYVNNAVNDGIYTYTYGSIVNARDGVWSMS